MPNRTSTALIIVLVAALSALQPVSTSAFPPLPQQDLEPRVVYIRDGNVWITDRTGQFHDQLTSGGHDTEPVISPDGTLVAYLATPPQYLGSAPTPQNLCMVDLLARNTNCLTGEPAIRGGLVWSHDGARLAYVEDRRLIVLNVDSNTVRVLAANVAAAGPFSQPPAWAPDDSALACVLAGDTESGIWAIDSHSGARRLLHGLEVPAALPLAFTPDGTSVTFVNPHDDGRLWSVPFDGSDPIRLGALASAPSRGPQRHQDPHLSLRGRTLAEAIPDVIGSKVYSFAWSPAGDKLAYSTLDGAVRIFDLLTGASGETIREASPGPPPRVVWPQEDPEAVLLYTPAVGGSSLSLRSLTTGQERLLTPGVEPVGQVAESTLASPLVDIGAPFEWYRYQGEWNSGPCADVNCGPTAVAMAIQFADDNRWVPIGEIRDQMTGGICGWTDLDHVRGALSHWGIKHTSITGMDAVRDAVNERGHIVIVPVWMSYIPPGSDYLLPYSSPSDRFNRYYEYGLGHFVVVKGITEDGNWVIVHDPNVWDDNGIYRYADGSVKGHSRYYRYSDFATAFADNGNIAVEILPPPSHPPPNDDIDQAIDLSVNGSIGIIEINPWVSTQRLVDLGYKVTLLPASSGLDVFRHFDLIYLPVLWADAFSGDYAELESRAADYRAYVHEGGGLLVDQPNPYQQPGESVSPTLLPYPITFYNGYRIGERPLVIADPDHYLTRGLDPGTLPAPVDQVTAIDPAYTVLVRGRASGSPSLIAAEYGQGRVVIQADRPDAVGDEAQRRMVDWAMRGDRQLGFSFALDTRAATTAGDDPVLVCGSADQGSASVWYRLAPLSRGIYDADTVGSDYDTVLSVWTGTRGSLTSAACDDGSGAGLASSVALTLTSGVTYSVQVAANGAGSPGGLLALGTSFTPCHTLSTLASPLSGGLLAADPAPNCGTNSYTHGSIVTVTATPVSGYSFVEWGGDLRGSTGPASVSMKTDLHISASFTGATAPGSIQVAGGTEYVNSTAVTLTLSAGVVGGEVTGMRFSNDGVGYTEWLSFTTTTPWTLLSGDGAKTVHAQFIDGAGTVSTVVTDTVTLDTIAPTGSILIQGGADVVTHPQVTLSLEGSDLNGLAAMRLRNDADPWSDWESFVPSRQWALPARDGEHEVSLQVQDLAGNLSPVYSDTVVLEQSEFCVFLPLALRNW